MCVCYSHAKFEREEFRGAILCARDRSLIIVFYIYDRNKIGNRFDFIRYKTHLPRCSDTASSWPRREAIIFASLGWNSLGAACGRKRYTGIRPSRLIPAGRRCWTFDFAPPSRFRDLYKSRRCAKDVWVKGRGRKKGRERTRVQDPHGSPYIRAFARVHDVFLAVNQRVMHREGTERPTLPPNNV